MLRYLLLSIIPFMLISCQASNPYQADGKPLPPAPPEAAQHFDRSSYPAQLGTQDYNYWCWQHLDANQSNPVYPPDSAQGIVAEQLEQYGLRAATYLQQCELKILFSSQHGQRTNYNYYDRPYPSVSLGYGYGRFNTYHAHYRHSGIGINFPITPRAYTENYQQLTLSFIDAKTGQQIWQGRSTVSHQNNSTNSIPNLREAIRVMLDNYHR